MGISDPLTCLLRNLYAGQEATVRTGHGTTDWFKIGKGILQGCILSPWSFNLYSKCIMGNAGLDELQVGIKIAKKNIKTCSEISTTSCFTLMAESKEELKSILMNAEEESEKTGLNSAFKKLRSWHLVHHFMANILGNNGNSDRLYFLVLQNHCGWWL